MRSPITSSAALFLVLGACDTDSPIVTTGGTGEATDTDESAEGPTSTGGETGTTNGSADGSSDPGASHTVFVTSTVHGADFGGLAGADSICQQAAGGLTGSPAVATYKAWLGTASEPAADRLEHWAQRYVRTDGSQVAVDWNNLVDGAIDVRINVDEHGAQIEGVVLVWTGTRTDGEFAGQSCGNWGSADPARFADVGSADDDELSWTSFGEMACDQQLRLYCIEQTPSCGDGVRNAGEACDGDGAGVGGETPTCDADCSMAECGDGTVNAAAGEACDDGNRDDLDGCTNTCAAASCDDGIQNLDEIDVDCGGHCGAGSCLGEQACAQHSDCASMVCDAGHGRCIGEDCRTLFGAGVATDGVYAIDPDGPGPTAPFEVYCDMTNSGGGWTLAARFSNADAEDWMLDTGVRWYDRVVETGAPTDPSIDQDAQSRAFWTVPATEIRLTRSDQAGNPTLFRTNRNCLDFVDFRTFVTSFGDFRDGAVWGSNAVARTCPGVFSNGYVATRGFEQALCTGDIGAPNSVSFWADWGSGDGAVIMIGGGGAGCSGADHGIGLTEANAASFDAGGTEEIDFGGHTDVGASGYSLNLWVR